MLSAAVETESRCYFGFRKSWQVNVAPSRTVDVEGTANESRHLGESFLADRCVRFLNRFFDGSQQSGVLLSDFIAGIRIGFCYPPKASCVLEHGHTYLTICFGKSMKKLDLVSNGTNLFFPSVCQWVSQQPLTQR